jgi:4-amino-4-deoxy-L-arabinose transferase-like glycosyltransferase
MTTPNQRVSHRAWWGLIAACLAPALLSLFNELQDVDPAQYADVARRMLDGHWLAMRDMTGPFVNKPPLMMWAQAAAMGAVGVTSFAARLPALLFGLLALLATFLIGRELRDSKHGLVAATLLGASVAFHHMVLDPKVDMPLTAMSSLAVWAVLASRRRRWLLWPAWAFAALAVLSKGPIGLALPVMALGPELLRAGGFSGEPSFLRRVLWVKPGRGLLLMLVLVTPYYFATANAAGGGALVTLLWTLGPGRLLGDTTWRDNTTPLYFVHTGLWALLPFTPLLLAALVRRLASLVKAGALPPDVARVPLWWLLVPFVVISFSSYKLPQYIYWLAPPAALLAAEELRGLSLGAHRVWRRGLLALALATGALGALVVGVGFPAHWPWLALMAGVPCGAWWATRGGEPEYRTTALVASSTLGFLAYFHGGLQPALLEYQPSREIAALVRARDPDAAVLPCLDVTPAFSLSFYAQREVTVVGLSELAAMVAGGRARVAVVAEGRAQALEAAGLRVESLGRFATFRTSVPTRAFLDRRTREGQLGHVELVGLTPR